VTKRTTAAGKATIDRPPPSSIARLAFTLLVNQYRTKKEYFFFASQRTILPQIRKIGRFRTE
jgi:hypothetical protein